ncbi:CLUMA_CG002797, isoform A [Clunio marinus]|uniref:CLUMA_CG002797, isoform A n=1 Tax=Clunio marinus TaxID=568069 RepID=A0A1J1HM42_9DIPT|nr:CLUMA_CG002797, isoform A [Clunio marinus]
MRIDQEAFFNLPYLLHIGLDIYNRNQGACAGNLIRRSPVRIPAMRRTMREQRLGTLPKMERMQLLPVQLINKNSASLKQI